MLLTVYARYPNDKRVPPLQAGDTRLGFAMPALWSGARRQYDLWDCRKTIFEYCSDDIRNCVFARRGNCGRGRRIHERTHH